MSKNVTLAEGLIVIWGAIIAAPDSEYAKAMDGRRKASASQGYTVLRLADFNPVSNFGDFPFKKAVEKKLASYADAVRLYPISNTQAILVNGNIISIV